MKLKDKVAIVTGSGDGIGKAVALAYLSEGARVVFVDIDKKALEQISKELKVENDRYLMCPTDLTKKKDIENMVDAVLKKYDTIDILVNHLGDAKFQPFSEVSDNDFDFAVNMTLRSNIWVTKAVIPVMLKNMYGKIINTASMVGKIGWPNSSLLCMTKHGIVGLTKALAVEYGRFNVNINAVCPSLLETKSSVERIVPNFKFAKDIITANTPLGRLTTIDEISRLYVFLASEEAGFMTGQAINWTGGFVMA